MRMKILRTCIFALLIFALSVMTCAAFEGRAASKDGNLVVTYKVEEEYKITVRIDTKRKKGAYLKTSEGDVVKIQPDFVDVNGDGLQDVIIKYADETGYSPVVLINHGDISFKDALRGIKKNEPLYINTELEIKEGGPVKRGRDYELKDLTGDVPKLIFYRAFMGGKGYRYVAFRYDKRTTSYVLYKKGELFEEH